MAAPTRRWNLAVMAALAAALPVQSAATRRLGEPATGPPPNAMLACVRYLGFQSWWCAGKGMTR